MNRRAGERGTSFVELMVSISIVAVALMVMLTQITISFREASINEHRAFGYRKAMAMIEEVRNGVERGDIPDAESLDDIADLAGKNPTLTTLADESGNGFVPDHPMSGNVWRHGSWVWGREFSVEEIPGQDSLRKIRAAVSRRRDGGSWESMATVSAVVSLPPRAYAATKYYDLYVLALAQTPGLWQQIAAARTLLENARAEMQTVENGLKLRLHWITRLGYGRDPIYTPFVNTQTPATDAAPHAYWYPGLLSSVSGDLYNIDLLTGRVRDENGLRNGHDLGTNPEPHAIADQFNHCMRLPQARRLFDARVAAGLEQENSPPLQILLEDMWADPDRYRNAIFVNLHGPGMPLPPLRNYSDAAKEPVGHSGVRVVTHPERIWTRRDPADWASSSPARFRVHAYKTDPDTGPLVTNAPIMIQIPGVDLTGSVNGSDPTVSLQISKLVGGVSEKTGLDTGGGRKYQPFALAPALPSASEAFEMSYEVGFVAGPPSYTWIELHNTPLVTTPDSDEGLAAAERLYGMEHIPSPVAAGGAFVDLSASGLGGPKNTARWLISVPPKALDATFAGGFGGNSDQIVEVLTRIGTDDSTGVAWPVPHQPHNLSTTYTWWTASPETVPVTERYQYQGDPRHNPYADLVAGGASFAHGYNWHFDDLRESLYDATVKWPCLDAARIQDGFGVGNVVDAPRLLQLQRRSLQACGGVFVNPCGPAAQAVLVGGEIALPGTAPGAATTAVSLHGDFAAMSGAQLVDSIAAPLPSTSVVLGRQVILGSGGDPFWSKEWLGELFPDSAYSTYLATGNLPTGGTPGTYHREPRGEAMLAGLPPGTDFSFGASSILGLAGGLAMLDGGTLGATFVHRQELVSPVGTETPAAESIADAVGDTLPDEMPATWPFDTDLTFPGAVPYFGFTADYPKSRLSLLEQHYAATGEMTAAGCVAAEAPATLAAGFYAVMGLSPSSTEDHTALAMGSLMLGLRTFHRAGEPSVTGRVVQTPLVVVVEPAEGATLTNPSSVVLQWKTSFKRFDGEVLTTGYPTEFGEPESDLEYSVLYSTDEGLTWNYALNSMSAEPETRPPSALLFADNAVGNETLVVNTPSGTFPGGEYLWRVECYHKSRRPHLSLHQVRVLVTR